jgi:hypothetical protein
MIERREKLSDPVCLIVRIGAGLRQKLRRLAVEDRREFDKSGDVRSVFQKRLQHFNKCHKFLSAPCAVFPDFQKVEPSLTGFHLANVTLRFTQPCSQLRLRDARAYAQFP